MRQGKKRIVAESKCPLTSSILFHILLECLQSFEREAAMIPGPAICVCSKRWMDIVRLSRLPFSIPFQ